MRKPQTVKALEEFGRVRLSPNFFMREFLYSEIAVMSGIANLPDDPDLTIAAGSRLCAELLEPLQATFGRIALRSGYRSCAVNEYGNRHGFNCARNEADYAGHIWDRRDPSGHMGAKQQASGTSRGTRVLPIGRLTRSPAFSNLVSCFET